MWTLIWHASYAWLAFFVGLTILFSLKNNSKNNNNTISFALFFFLLAIYGILLNSYLIIDNLFLVKEIYIIATLIFYLMLILAEETVLNMLKIKKFWRRFFSFSLFLLAMLVSFLQINVFILPTIDDGIILWNMDQYSAWITSLAGFSVAMTWVYAFVKNITRHDKETKKAYVIKNYLIVLASLAMGVASLSYFHSNKLLLQVAFFSALVSVLSMMTTLIVSRFCFCEKDRNILK